ncbi:Integrase core domain protein [Pseudovibrio sp. WM33]|nr:Integrase core domain protein [Pseudovibrio sp. WM33]
MELLTPLWTSEGWLYLAIVVDLFSRRIVGWATSNRMKTDLVTTALKRVLATRTSLNGLIHHSDRGSQYCSDAYQRLLSRHKITPSMSGKGNCFDNSMVETALKTIKSEMLWRTTFQTRQKAEKALGLYIEGFYNPIRRHSSLGYQSPIAFERQKRNSETEAFHFL